MFRGADFINGRFIGRPALGEYDLADPTLSERMLVHFAIIGRDAVPEGTSPPYAVYQSYEEPVDMVSGELLLPRQLTGVSGTVTVREIDHMSLGTGQPTTFVVEANNLVLSQNAALSMGVWPPTVSVATARMSW